VCVWRCLYLCVCVCILACVQRASSSWGDPCARPDESVFQDLFLFAAPKFVAPIAPNYDSALGTDLTKARATHSPHVLCM
jgi:hypothetical protein